MKSSFRSALISAAAATLVITTAGLASADNVTSDVLGGGNSRTVARGASTTVNYSISPTGNTCDPADGTPVTLRFSLPTGVTASASSFVLSDCTSSMAVTFAVGSTAVTGSYDVQPTAADDDPTDTYNSVPARFTLVVPAPTASDSVKPVVTITLPSDGGDGWYNAAETAANFGAVMASVTATDAVGVKTLNCTGTGVSTGTPTGLDTTSASAQLTITGEGSRTVTCTATDAVPNTGSDSETVAIDTVAPSVTHSLDPVTPDGNAPWYVTDVTVTWHVGGGDIAASSTCQDGDQDTLDFDTAAVGIVFGCSATDTHGNTSSDSVTLRRDAAVPTVNWAPGTPADGADYFFGDTVPTAGCEASDPEPGSGLDGDCVVGGVGNTLGTHNLTASVSDVAGNVGSATPRSYTVHSWKIDGFYQPVDMNNVFNTVKAGSTVPLKFNVFKSIDDTFSDDERMTSGIGAEFTMKPIACPNAAILDAIEDWALTGKTELRYDAVGKQWIQNWSTPKGGAGSCYAVTMKTADGSSITANFKLK